MFSNHQYCRACGCGKPHLPTLKVSTAAGDSYDKPQGLIPVLDLGIQPLANDFKPSDGVHAGYYPLKVLLCPKCSLAQLSVVVDPHVLYDRYAYVTSHSQTMIKHFDVLRNDILAETTAANSVLEIGSNDGTFLGFLKNNPFQLVLGCDPAENLASIANQNGIPTFCGLFTEDNCDCQKQKDVVIARHVMCHVDDWNDFMRGLERVTHSESLVVIEVPYYKDMITRRSWDQVYAEHLSYMSVRAMLSLCCNSMFHIHKVKHYGIHGGAIGIFLRRNESLVPPDEGVQQWLDGESNALEEWKSLSEAKDEMVQELRKMVVELNRDGKTVVGYGASAKSTVWMNACGFTKKEVGFICDSTPQKQYTLSPGSDVPIADEGALTRELPSHAILFSWNYADEIIAKEAVFRKYGGRWISPVPQISVT